MKVGKKALMQALFWRAMRRALYEDQMQQQATEPARMEWKAAA